MFHIGTLRKTRDYVNDRIPQRTKVNIQDAKQMKKCGLSAVLWQSVVKLGGEAEFLQTH